MLRLTPAGARLIDGWRAGAEVGAGEGARRLAARLIEAELAHPRPSGGAVTPADVAVVIPARDRAGELAACLARIDRCREIVIVDDGSRDPSAIAAVADERALVVAALPEVHRRGVRVLRREVSGGPAAARNAGLAATDAPFVAFVDSDAVPGEGWLEPLLAHFGDPRVGAVAPRVRVPPGRSLLARYEAARSPLDLGPDPGIVGPGRRIGYVPAAALVLRRAALDVSSAAFQRILMFLNPEAGSSVNYVYRLSRLYDRLSERSALVMLAAWRGSTMAVARAKYRAALYDDERHRARSAPSQTKPAVQPGSAPAKRRSQDER